MEIRLAKKEEITDILSIIEERCNWLKENGIHQWANNYVGKYNANYFEKAMIMHKLFIVKQGGEIVGSFLLKEEDKTYWNNIEPAYYIHHLATKLGYKGVGAEILTYIEKLARENKKEYIRLDCKKSNIELNQYYQNQGFQYKGSGEEPYSYNLWEKRIK